MINDIKNSIKAKLYDFAYTPFMSSTIISWMIINHKYILIYMADYTLDKKLDLLNNYDFSYENFWFNVPLALNVIFPLLFGLFYVFIYPMISKKFYEYTLKKNKDLKKIKQEIEDTTPITQEEARALRDSINQLNEEKYELEKKLIEVKDRNKRITELRFNGEKIPEPVADTRSVSHGEILNKVVKEDDRTKILRFFYESNYKYAEKDELLDVIFNRLDVVRPKARLIINNLIEENILEIDSYGQVLISEQGNSKLLNIFDRKK